MLSLKRRRVTVGPRRTLRARRRAQTAAIVAVAGAALLANAPAPASFRGSNGDIAFISTTQERVAVPCTSTRTQDCTGGEVPLVMRRFLVRVGSDGSVRKILPVAGTFGAFRGSPDGRRLAFDENEAIYVSDLRGHHRRRIARTGTSPAWSPDGRRVAFADDRALWVVGAGGRGLRRLTAGERDSGPKWSPDGRSITFIRGVRFARRSPCAYGSDLYTMAAAGGRPHRLFRPAFACGSVDGFDWSPSGRRLVVATSEGLKEDTPADPRARGVAGLALLDRDGTGLRQIQDHAVYPVWSPDGRRIAFFGDTCRTPQDIGQVLCSIRPDGRGLQHVSAVRDDIFAGFPADWLVRPR